MGLGEHAATIAEIAKKHCPSVVVEVGLKYATSILIPIFKKRGCKRYIGIDPVDRYQCPKEFQDVFEYKQGLSADFLPQIPEADMVMLDGDHNYYAVTEELEVLHKTLKPGGVILMHDVEEPWARKDLYYDKSRIPPEWIDGPKQGVLTAVEDFLSKHGDDYLPLKIYSGQNGLGYLVRKGASDKPIGKRGSIFNRLFGAGN